MEWVCGLEDLDVNDRALAGGKGANLGAMLRAGLPVPGGFVVLTAAYREFVEHNRLRAEIEQIAAAANGGDVASLDKASDALRALFARGAIPPELEGAITGAYERLGGRVAVRSSASAEDLPEASFAGQQETYLNVEGRAALLGAVKGCWSSLFTARALSYRAKQGVGEEDLALAVVVQRLVEADAAGVLFTADPVSGRRDRMVIDAAWGLGEALVGGQVTPDHWLVDARTGAPLERRIAAKRAMTVQLESGTETRAVPAERREASVLDGAGVSALVELGRRAEALFGAPQDVEWVLRDGGFALVQSRPITSLFPLPEPAAPIDGPLRVHISVNFLQGLLEPFTPAGIDFLGRLARGPAGLLGVKLAVDEIPPVFKVAAGRIYVDVTAALAHPRTRRIVFGATSFLDQPTQRILEHVVEREAARLAPERPRLSLRPSPSLPLIALCRAFAALVAPERSRRKAIARAERAIVQLDREAAAATEPEARRRFLHDAPTGLFGKIVLGVLPTAAAGLAMRFLAERQLERWLGDASGLQPVLRSLPHNPTTEMDLVLWRLAQRLRAEGAAPSAEHPGVREFLDRFGQRAAREIDVGVPRWRDDPGYVLEVLSAFQAQGDAADAEAHFRAGAEAAERAAAALVREVREKQGRVRSLALRFMLSRVRALAGMREVPKFFLVRAVAVARRVLGGLGRELAAAGQLDDPDDVYFLRSRDVKGDLRPVASTHRAHYQRELARRSVPRVITSEGETFFAAPAAAAGALEGVSASVGVYEGPVRVIREPRGASLEPGEVLVAPGTDPAWTPLFLTAGALVMEIGGIMSHGSVVAREYGIPAVVGVTEATTRLRTGQRVRVDGEAGTVLPLD